MIRRCVATLALGLLLLSPVLTSACFVLDPVQTRECGNQVLEDKEDCDLFVEGAPACGMPTDVNACFFTCDLDPDNVLECPEGFGCGADKRCRRASNRFAAQSTIPFSAPSFEIGDFDGDGNPDVIGATANRLNVAFGSSSGTLETVGVAPTSAPRPFFSLADLNGDNRTDVVAATLFGISVHLGTADRLLQPQAFPSFTIPNNGRSLSGTTALSPTDGGSTEVRVFSVVAISNQLLIDIDGEQATNLSELALPGLDTNLNAVFDAIDTPLAASSLDETNPTDLDEYFFTYDGADRVWVLGFLAPEATGAVSFRQQVVLPDGFRVFGRPLAVDLDGDDDLDLILSARTEVANGPDVIALAIAFNTAGVLRDGANQADVFTTFLLGPLQFNEDDRLLVAGDFDGHDGFDFVTTNGIFLSHSDEDSLFEAVDYLDAALGDFNKDGRTDVVGLSANTLGAELLLLTPTGRFNRFGLGTSEFSSPQATGRVIVGDFDGDFIDDAIMTAPGTTGKLDVFAFYGGTNGGFVEPRSLARFESINQAFINPSLEGTIDSVLVSENKGGVREVSNLQGDTSRSLLAPLVLIDVPAGKGDDGGVHIPFAAVAGNFVLGESSGLVAATARINDDAGQCVGVNVMDPPPGACSHSWQISGDGQGALLRDATEPSSVPLALEKFACRSFVAGDVLGQGVEQLIMIAKSPGCDENLRLAIIDFKNGEPELIQLELPDQAIDHELVDVLVTELNGELSSKEIAVSFRRPDGNGGGGVAIYQPRDLKTASQTLTFETFRPFGLTAADFTGDGSAELNIAGTRNADDGGGFETWLAVLDRETGLYEQPNLQRDLSTGRFVRSADMNSDGVEDLIIGDDVSVTVFLGVPAAALGDLTSDSESTRPPAEIDAGQGS